MMAPKVTQVLLVLLVLLDRKVLQE